MTAYQQLVDAIAGLCPAQRPVVVHSALWPFAKMFPELRGEALAQAVIDAVLQALPGRTVAMPAFTPGFRDGVCDLDATPSSTGAITELFRRRPGVRRSVSAFFSYAVMGPDSAAVLALRPEHAWGDDSFYGWMEQVDATILLLGCHSTHISYLHRLEWLLRGRLPYRYDKRFCGTLIHEGRESQLCETLLVRSLAPEAINDFTVLAPALQAAGMRYAELGGVAVAAIETRQVRDGVLPLLQADPLYCLKNRQDFAVINKD